MLQEIEVLTNCTSQTIRHSEIYVPITAQREFVFPYQRHSSCTNSKAQKPTGKVLTVITIHFIVLPSVEIKESNGNNA
jgi:hypothetical protein